MATKRSRASGAPQESRNENQHGNLSLEKKGCRSLMQKYGTLLECPRELWIIYFLKFLESFSYYTLAVTMTLYLSQEFGYSDTASGTAYGMMGMLTSIYGFLVGFIIDNLGVKNSRMWLWPPSRREDNICDDAIRCGTRFYDLGRTALRKCPWCACDDDRNPAVHTITRRAHKCVRALLYFDESCCCCRRSYN